MALTVISQSFRGATRGYNVIAKRFRKQHVSPENGFPRFFSICLHISSYGIVAGDRIDLRKGSHSRRRAREKFNDAVLVSDFP